MSVFFSFNSSDAYYKRQAEGLAQSLAELGLEYHIEEVEIPDDLEWPDVCRMKIKMLLDFYEKNPGKRVFWIDADCRITGFPDVLRNFSADLVGFQRGFGKPLNIGYQTKSRFWEPCFIGFNATEKAHAFLKRASELEQNFDGRATDDYFFEEAWREHCDQLSFQIVPSQYAVLEGRVRKENSLKPFFFFGSSGNVKIYINQVDQHRVDWIDQPPQFLLKAKKIKARLKKSKKN